AAFLRWRGTRVNPLTFTEQAGARVEVIASPNKARGPRPVNPAPACFENTSERTCPPVNHGLTGPPASWWGDLSWEGAPAGSPSWAGWAAEGRPSSAAPAVCPPSWSEEAVPSWAARGACPPSSGAGAAAYPSAEARAACPPSWWAEGPAPSWAAPAAYP